MVISVGPLPNIASSSSDKQRVALIYVQETTPTIEATVLWVNEDLPPIVSMPPAIVSMPPAMWLSKNHRTSSILTPAWTFLASLACPLRSMISI